MKKRLLVLPLAVMLLGGCGGSPNPNPNPSPVVPTKTLNGIAVTTQPTKTTYTEGEYFDASGMVVTASYSDDSSEAITNYSIPNQALTVGTNSVTISYGGKTAQVAITVAPKPTAKEIFVRAKNKTYENDVYEYTYSAKAQIKFKDAVSWSPAQLSGTIQYDSGASGTQYMHKKEVTGALVFDYTTYTYNQGLDLITVNANESKDFSIVNKDKLPNNYQFETNSIGCILRTLADNDNLAVTKSGNQYNLNLKTSFAQDSFLHVLNYVDSKKIVDTLSEFATDKWGVGFGYNCYATLNASETTVSSFHFDASVSIKDTVEIGFEFDQNFTKVGSGVKIQLPEFENTFVSKEDISAQLAPLSSALDVAKEKYYEYKVHTKVDHGVSKSNPLGMGVDSTTKGETERQKIGNEVYFHNHMEVDSDYKNNDQFPDVAEDYQAIRSKLNSEGNPVYDKIKQHLHLTYDDPSLIKNYSNDSIDDYYMMVNDDLLSSDTVNILRKTTDKNENNVYRLGVSSNYIKSMLQQYNKSIRLDKDLEQHINVYNITNSFEAKKSEVEFTVDKDGKLTDINMKIRGFYVCETQNQVKFEFDLDIEFDHSHKAYTAIDNPKDIKGL